jgi:hypothetical protein
MEIWKDIVGYENIYQISNFSRVKSLSRIRVNGRSTCLTKDKILSPAVSKNNYTHVELLGKNKLIHRLVAAAFIPNPENKPQVNHINGIKTDNMVENLEWCTVSENAIHASKNRLSKTGEKHWKSKLTEKEVLEIRESKLSSKLLVEKYNVLQCTISQIKRNKTWKYIN